MKTALILVAVFTTLLISSQIYFIMAKTETQAYQIIKTEKDFRIQCTVSILEQKKRDHCERTLAIAIKNG
jgi:hypothetical protein